MASNHHPEGIGQGSSAARKKIMGIHGKNTARGVRRRNTGKGEVTEGEFAAERSSLITERQNELEGILDRHDTLVRTSKMTERFTISDW